MVIKCLPKILLALSLLLLFSCPIYLDDGSDLTGKWYVTSTEDGSYIYNESGTSVDYSFKDDGTGFDYFESGGSHPLEWDIEKVSEYERYITLKYEDIGDDYSNSGKKYRYKYKFNDYDKNSLTLEKGSSKKNLKRK